MYICVFVYLFVCVFVYLYLPITNAALYCGCLCPANIQNNDFNFSLQVADFGGTLSLFLGVSFITIWDNFHFHDILNVLRSKCEKVSHNRDLG